MKKLIILIVMTYALAANAQTEFVGIKAGGSLTNVLVENFNAEQHYRPGMLFGFSYEYIFQNNFSIGAELIYNQRGMRNHIQFTDNLGDPMGDMVIYKYNYDYLSLPLKIGINKGQTVSCFANIGLMPSVLISAQTITPEIQINQFSLPGQTYDVKSSVNKFDIGGLVEIGGAFKLMDRYYLSTSLAYMQSFTSITNSNYFSNSEIRHHGIMLNLGLKINLDFAE